MIISTSNELISNGFTLINGAFSDGDFDDLRSNNFSRVLVSTSSVLEFSCGAVGSFDYIALHGLRLRNGMVVSVAGEGFIKTYTVNNENNTNLVFYNSGGGSINDIVVRISGAGSKTISFIQAGQAVVSPWGVDSSQNLHYLSYNSESRSSIDRYGSPALRTQRKTNPNIRLNINNVTKDWARVNLRDILNHYQNVGVLSVLDYEQDDRPNESFAGFDMRPPSVMPHSQTMELVNISISMKASV